MVKHTLRTLGPKVLATPDAARVRRRGSTSRRPRPSPRRVRRRRRSPPARDLAAWKKQVRSRGASIRIEHVEADGVGDAVVLGTPITVRVFVTARRALRRRTWSSRRRTAGSTRTTASRHPGHAADGGRRDVRRRPLPVQPSSSPSTRTGRSATPSACCRSTRAPRLSAQETGLAGRCPRSARARPTASCAEPGPPRDRDVSEGLRRPPTGVGAVRLRGAQPASGELGARRASRMLNRHDPASPSGVASA